MLEEDMDIVYCIDQFYFKPAIVSAISLLVHLKKNNKKATIHIVHDGLQDDLKGCQSFFLDNYNAELKFYLIDKAEIPFRVGASQVHRERFDTSSMFYPLFIPDIFHKLDKVIYLDADTIVNGDISEIWDVDLKEYSMGAVLDPTCALIRNSTKAQYMQGLGMKSVQYINSGVLLMNLEKLREESFLSRSLDFYKQTKERLLWSIQDILNVILEGKILFLPPKFNNFNGLLPIYLSSGKLFENFGKKVPYTREQMREANINPCIIHYREKYKPWYYPCRYSINKEKYWHFYNLSPWKDENSVFIENFLNKTRRRRYFWYSLFNLLNIRMYIIFFLVEDYGVSFREIWRSYVQLKISLSRAL